VTRLVFTRLMANQLFGVITHDPLTFCTVAVLLALVALLACYIRGQAGVESRSADCA